MSIVYYGLNQAADQSENEVNVGTSTALADATTADTDAGTADTDVGTVVTDLATVLSDIDTFAAAVIAITGDTYTSHQFGLAASTGLTSTQVNTLFAALNTAITALLTSQTAANTAKTATAATKTATAAAKTSAALPNDVTLLMDLSKTPMSQDLQLILDAFERRLIYAGPSDIGNI